MSLDNCYQGDAPMDKNDCSMNQLLGQVIFTSHVEVYIIFQQLKIHSQLDDGRSSTTVSFVYYVACGCLWGTGDCMLFVLFVHAISVINFLWTWPFVVQNQIRKWTPLTIKFVTLLKRENRNDRLLICVNNSTWSPSVLDDVHLSCCLTVEFLEQKDLTQWVLHRRIWRRCTRGHSHYNILR